MAGRRFVGDSVDEVLLHLLVELYHLYFKPLHRLFMEIQQIYLRQPGSNRLKLTPHIIKMLLFQIARNKPNKLIFARQISRWLQPRQLSDRNLIFEQRQSQLNVFLQLIQFLLWDIFKWICEWVCIVCIGVALSDWRVRLSIWIDCALFEWVPRSDGYRYDESIDIASIEQMIAFAIRVHSAVLHYTFQLAYLLLGGGDALSQSELLGGRMVCQMLTNLRVC